MLSFSASQLVSLSAFQLVHLGACKLLSLIIHSICSTPHLRLARRQKKNRRSQMPDLWAILGIITAVWGRSASNKLSCYQLSGSLPNKNMGIITVVWGMSTSYHSSCLESLYLLRVSIVNSYNYHIIRERMSGKYPTQVDPRVYAPADAARADIEQAVLSSI